jgi:predicted GNAT family acetyltransferase
MARGVSAVARRGQPDGASWANGSTDAHEEGRLIGMSWQFASSVDAFADATGAFLAADPERHTLPLTIIDSVRGGFRPSEQEMHFGWWEPDGQVRGAVLMTPPYPLLLAGVPRQAMPGLVAGLRRRDAPVSGVNGEQDAAETFAHLWTAGTEVRAATAMRQRLYRLDSLTEPARPAPGRGRPAISRDLDLVAAWTADFHTEVGGEELSEDQIRQTSRRRVADGLIWLWEDDGEPVAMASRNPTIEGVARVGPVFTPVPFRRSGYGTAATVECTRDALASGARGVVLFTDRANPTSNAIYQEIGYRPVTDRVVIRFGDEA